jgi:hypothetical protein
MFALLDRFGSQKHFNMIRKEICLLPCDSKPLPLWCQVLAPSEVFSTGDKICFVSINIGRGMLFYINIRRGMLFYINIRRGILFYISSGYNSLT